MMITQLLPSSCTHCHKVVDGAGSIDTDDGPKPGDFTICIDCGHLMAFADDLTLRDLTEDEMVEITGDKRMLAVQRARKMTKAEREK
jgi:hypothetical protein